jgi:hypothetical protein
MTCNEPGFLEFGLAQSSTRFQIGQRALVAAVAGAAMVSGPLVLPHAGEEFDLDQYYCE